LDNQGEFASVREAVDVLLVGASGELPANPCAAALLARLFNIHPATVSRLSARLPASSTRKVEYAK
jgi:hypothetical protein